MPFFPGSDLRDAGLRLSKRTIRMRSARRCGRSNLRRPQSVPQPSKRSASGATCFASRLTRTAPRRAGAVRRDRAARRRAAWRDQRQHGRMHACACPACRPVRPVRFATIPNVPLLKFVEDACVQCGLCQSTCPEKVITLKPQIDFRAARAPARMIKEEEPALCIRCNKPFGVKSTIEKIAAKLEGRHWMYPAATNGSTRSECAPTAASSP